MTCDRYIDFSSPPYDESSVEGAYAGDDCPGVQGHFTGNPINVGDCIKIDGKDYRVTAARVKCDGQPVYSNGSPPLGIPPDHTHSYQNSPVEVELWLTEA
ncbi:MAG: hypothetical protein ACYTDY_04465 [Planctomycetota bacterium]|jgi:hypothetical protein